MKYRALIIYRDGSRGLLGLYKTESVATEKCKEHIRSFYKKSNAAVGENGLLTFQVGWMIQDSHTGEFVSSGEYEEAFCV